MHWWLSNDPHSHSGPWTGDTCGQDMGVLWQRLAGKDFHFHIQTALNCLLNLYLKWCDNVIRRRRSNWSGRAGCSKVSFSTACQLTLRNLIWQIGAAIQGQLSRTSLVKIRFVKIIFQVVKQWRWVKNSLGRKKWALHLFCSLARGRTAQTQWWITAWKGGLLPWTRWVKIKV